MSKHSHTGYRSDKTGHFVTKAYGTSHPSKVTKESIPNPGRGDTDRGRGK